MNNNLYFENVIRIEKLYLEHIFLEFEHEPIFFTCIDNKNRLYLCLCSEIREEQRWIIAECNVKTLQNLIQKKICMTDAICIPDTLIVIKRDLQEKEISYEVRTDTIDELDLPKSGIMLRCDEDAAMNYLYKKKWEDLSVELENSRDISIAYKAVVKAYITNFDSSFEVQNESVEPYDRYKRMDSYFSEIVQKYNVRKQGFFENIPIEIDDDSLSAA